MITVLIYILHSAQLFENGISLVRLHNIKKHKIQKVRLIETNKYTR